jgi:ABC-type spermidine/putrescine transport system permease subunit I
VPFFFFLFHLLFAHVFAIILSAFRYGPHRFLLLPPPSLGGSRDIFPADYGFSLLVVYVIWVGVVAISYPICRWYADLKNRRRDFVVAVLRLAFVSIRFSRTNSRVGRWGNFIAAFMVKSLTRSGFRATPTGLIA